MKNKTETLKECISDGVLINVKDLPKCIECVNCIVKTHPKRGEPFAIWQECKIDGKKVARDSFCRDYEMKKINYFYN
jgi:hypothetical protein